MFKTARIFCLSPSYYANWRTYLAVRNLAPLLVNEGIDLHIGDRLSLDYDAYVIHDCPPDDVWPLLPMLQQSGRLVWSVSRDVWHSDDCYKPIVDWLHERADFIWVPTQQLADLAGYSMGIVHVLPSLIDTWFWPEVSKPENSHLRIVYAAAPGDTDLDVVMCIYDQLLWKYDNILCLFVGGRPVQSSEWVRSPGTNSGVMVPASRYSGRLGYCEGVQPDAWPRLLTSLNADLAIVTGGGRLEYDMAGVATADNFELACELVEDAGLRRRLGSQARRQVLEGWTWEGRRRDLWMQAVREVVS